MNRRTSRHWPEAVGRCRLFCELEEDILKRIAASVLEKHYLSGEVIFRRGELAHELLVIQSGKVALQVSLPQAGAEEGRQVAVDMGVANDAVGWSSLVEPYVYTLTAVCVEETTAFSLGGARLRWLLAEDSVAGFAVMSEVARVIAGRLGQTRQVLISERSMAARASLAWTGRLKRAIGQLSP
jgi:CRP-like cAMP-binding protein